ncbi:hypothetical protein P5Y76_001723 [Campylobacter coli]|nr:hypothetical protein [Campylobacter coli]
MDEWELERQRQINLQNLRREEAERQNKYGTLEGDLLEAIFKLIGLAISLTFIVVVAILKWTFFFVIFLRNRFFLKWNWYIKTEKAVISIINGGNYGLLLGLFVYHITMEAFKTNLFYKSFYLIENEFNINIFYYIINIK